jgi:hypothetical protein
MLKKTVITLSIIGLLNACGGGSGQTTTETPLPEGTQNIPGNTATTTVANAVADRGDLWKVTINETANTAQIEVIDTAFGVVNQQLSLSSPTTTNGIKSFNYTGPNGATGTLSRNNDGEITLSGSVDRTAATNLNLTAAGSNKAPDGLAKLVGTYNVLETNFQFETQDNYNAYTSSSVSDVPDTANRTGFLLFGQAKLSLDQPNNRVTEISCFGGPLAANASSQNSVNACATTGDARLDANAGDRSFTDGRYTLSSSKPGIVEYFLTGITKPGQTYAQFSISSLENGLRGFSGDVKGINDTCRPDNTALCRANIGRNIYVKALPLNANDFRDKVYECKSSGVAIGRITFNSAASVVTSTIDVLPGTFNVLLNKAPNGDYESYDSMAGFTESTGTIDFSGFATLVKQGATSGETRSVVLPSSARVLYVQIPINVITRTNYVRESQALAVCTSGN